MKFYPNHIQQLKYIKQQDWFPQFLSNYDSSFERGNHITIFDSILMNAFDWGASPEGYEFWQIINNELETKFPMETYASTEFFSHYLKNDYPECFT